MATIFPEGWRELKATGAAARELETLTLLADTLPDAYRIYHGVHWTRVTSGYQIWGEIDFAILSPSGKLLLLEQKSGFLSETENGLYKLYNKQQKSVPAQMARSLTELHLRLKPYTRDAQLDISNLLYCPDYTVQNPGTAGIAPERIVDSSKREFLPQIIQTILPLEAAQPIAESLHNFLCDILQLTPDANAYAGQARLLYTRLSGGLAEWARKVQCQPFRLRVTGTAGSGKTQLAINVFRDAIHQHKRPLYVCYNRPLADHFARAVPAGGLVTSYHQLCNRLYQQAGHTPDFGKDAFEKMTAFMDAYAPSEAEKFDEIIVDEGQDFHPQWKTNLLKFLKDEGKFWWLEDPLQKLYQNDNADLSGWVTIKSDTNYRTPRDVMQGIRELLTLPESVQSGSPLTGASLEIYQYNDDKDLLDKTKKAITECLKQGYTRDMITVISFRGLEKSLLSKFDKLGNFSLRKFTGQYDLLSNPVFTEGDVLFDSVYRFKGQSASCIIFTEIDFEEMDEKTLRKLFVGMTRATMSLGLVVSGKSAKLLEN
jgi:hypothetical protein